MLWAAFDSRSSSRIHGNIESSSLSFRVNLSQLSPKFSPLLVLKHHDTCSISTQSSQSESRLLGNQFLKLQLLKVNRFVSTNRLNGTAWGLQLRTSPFSMEMLSLALQHAHQDASGNYQAYGTRADQLHRTHTPKSQSSREASLRQRGRSGGCPENPRQKCGNPISWRFALSVETACVVSFPMWSSTPTIKDVCDTAAV